MSNFKYFNINKKWNNYGKVQDISNLQENEIDIKLNEFSEGSNELYKVLKFLNSNEIKTRACCKGSHLTIKTNDLVGISSEAYIAFENEEWISYLSDDILNNKNIIITKNSIKFYGENPNDFFNELLMCFEKKNINDTSKINTKLLEVTTIELRKKCFRNALVNIGFDNDQVNNIYNSYWEFKEINKKMKNEYTPELEKLNNKALEKYTTILIKAVEDNNRKYKQ